LKSLNLLLDAKWNVKVSDFGLTKFKEDVKIKTSRDVAGSVHWTAPEVLNESGDADLILADVYSFGIILWELHTRTQPYAGMRCAFPFLGAIFHSSQLTYSLRTTRQRHDSPAAVAVSVIRDNLRPTMPESESSSVACPPEYEELITSCWHHDPTIRPTFLEIMTRLSSMNGDSASAGMTSFTSKTSSSNASSSASGGKPNIYSSWTMPSTNSSSNGSSGSSSSKNLSATGAAGTGAGGAVRAPEGEMAIVFTDITRAASLWEFNAAAMRDATLMHNETLRAALAKHGGYEVVFLRDRNSGEGSFCMAFQHASDAVAWCGEVQAALLKVEWPEALLEHPGAAEEWGDTDDRVVCAYAWACTWAHPRWCATR
jgi:serine/threonine protein kinase